MTRPSELGHKTVRLKNYSASVICVFGRFFAWIGDLDHPHYIAHAVTESRAVELLAIAHEQQFATVEVMKETIAMYGATLLRISGHPSKEEIFLGMMGCTHVEPMLACARSRDGCVARLESIFLSTPSE